MDDIVLKDGFEAMDFARVTAMLATAYWCLGIGREEVEAAARNSALVVGAFGADDLQIGYLRVISDRIRFAYLVDVFVDPTYRGRGVATAMVHRALEHPTLADVYQWLLITRDAHELYRGLGFSVTARPNDWMEIRKPKPSFPRDLSSAS